MTDHVMETVTFKLNADGDRAAFADAARAMNAYVEGCPGFIARRLSCTAEGLWIEQIEWASMDDARAAAAGIGDAPVNAPFLQAIDGPSATVMHSQLMVAVN